MAENPQTTLEDFRRVLSFRNQDGEQLVVVGGQAVNFWAEYYLGREPDIAAFLPFTSRDLDMLGSGDDLLGIASAVGYDYAMPEPGDATPVVGIVNFKTSKGISTKIEILFTLRGLSNAELKAGVLDIYNPGLGLNVRVLDPITCLKSKTHNLVGLDQDSRQDQKHVKILMLCNRAFLRDILADAEGTAISERAAVNSFEALFKFTQSRIASEAAKRFGLDWSRAFPFPELKQTAVTRLQKFFERRLQKAFPACVPPKP